MNHSSSFNPNWVSPPGDTILDILQYKKLSLFDFAKRFECTLDYLNSLLAGSTIIDNEVANKLEYTLGASSDFWITREHQYREYSLKLEEIQKEEWAKSLPKKDMLHFGWITNPSSEALLDYFGVSNLNAWHQKYSTYTSQIRFRQHTSFKSEFASIATWLRQGEILSDRIKCNPWNPALFEEKLMKDIRPLTRSKDPKVFIPRLTQICAECGVAVAIVRTPSGCSASGATMFLNQDRALLMLSFRYLSDDQFWFTFFHEAAHLILHGDTSFFIEDTSDHFSKIDEEIEANIFASEILIPHEARSTLQSIRGKKAIIGFASSVGISPGILVGQMQYEGLIDKKYLNSYKRRYDWDAINLAYPAK